MRLILTLLSLLLMLTSCGGGKSPQSKLKIDLSNLGLISTQGGLVLFGKSLKGETFTRVISVSSGTGSVQEELPHGTWNLGAVAWNGDRGFKGDITCAFTTTELSTDTAVVNLTLTNQRCFESDVAEPGTFTGTTLKSFGFVTLNACEGSVSSRITTCDYSPTIRPIQRGFVGSYKIFIPAGRSFNSGPAIPSDEALESLCFSDRTNSNPEPGGSPTYDSSSSLLQVPAFLPSVSLPVQVRTYLSPNCDESKGVLVRNLTNPDEARITNYATGYNYLHVWTPANSLCLISNSLNITDRPASGNGNLYSPFLICSEEQVMAIQRNFSGSFGLSLAKSSVYVLGRDMNFLKFLKIDALATTPNLCSEIGDTFVPIGLTWDAACNPTTVLAESGFHFDGNEFTIRYMRFRLENLDNLGFIRYLNSASLYDIKFDRAQVEGALNVGVAVGVTSGALMKNVHVSDSTVEGDAFVGGVFGNDGGGSQLNLLFGKNLEIESRGAHVGGIVGFTASPLTNVSFDGSVYADSGSTYIGGVAGKAADTISNAVAKGMVRAQGTYIGGIVGEGQAVSYARSEVYIKDQDSNPSGARFIGGIVGDQTTFVTDRSFFTGSIDSRCSGPGCEIGAIAGSGVTPTNSFTTYVDARGGLSGDDATHNLNSSFTTAFLGSLCLGEAVCLWTQTQGSKPLLSTIEGAANLPLCSRPEYVKTLLNQLTDGRGLTAANPLIICRPSQFLEVTGGPYFYALGDHINLSGLSPMGNFTGQLNGQNYFLHSFTDLAVTDDSALFDTITSSAGIRNLGLAGFRITSASCGSLDCEIGSLAKLNQGEIFNVTTKEVDLIVPNAGTIAGGLVAVNDSLISGAHVSADINVLEMAGGIAGHNLGTISKSISYVHFSPSTTTTDYVGGIAAKSSGTLARNKFGGEMWSFPQSSFVGGIVGEALGSAVVTNNEFNDEGQMQIGTGSSNVGGIVGFANSPVTISKNLSAGVIVLDDPISSVKSILGQGTAVPAANYPKTVPADFVDTGTITGSNYAVGVCTITITGTITNSASTYPGGLSLNNNWVFGEMTTLVSTTDYILEVNTTASECGDFNTGSVSLYQSTETPVDYSVAQLLALGWDVADISGSGSEKIFDTYIAWIQRLAPSAEPPVWINDPDDRGLSLFLEND